MRVDGVVDRVAQAHVQNYSQRDAEHLERHLGVAAHRDEGSAAVGPSQVELVHAARMTLTTAEDSSGGYYANHL